MSFSVKGAISYLCRKSSAALAPPPDVKVVNKQTEARHCEPSETRRGNLETLGDCRVGAEAPPRNDMLPADISPIDLSENKRTLLKILTSDKAKNIINITVNGSAVLLSLATFANGNLHFYDPIQTDLEGASELLSKIAFSSAHLIGAVSLFEKKNFFPFLGYASAVPIALLSSGYNLLLATGISAGLINLVVVIDQREVTDKGGNPVLDENGNPQTISGDFKDKGWKESIITTLREGKKMIFEVVQKPKKIISLSHAGFISSLTQIAGSILGFLGFTNTGAYLRNAGTMGAETSFLLHKDKKDKTKNNKLIDVKSPITQAAILWNSSAVLDVLKRLPILFVEKVSNLTALSLMFDRLASIRFTQGIMDIKKDEKQEKQV